MQAQEYPAARWALAARTAGCVSADVDAALADGSIIRTHILRPTWHFVTPDNIRWMMDLTAPRVHALSAYYYRKTGLDYDMFAKCEAVFAKVLRGGKQLTRAELEVALQDAGLYKPAEDRLRLTYILMHAELEMVICSGGMRGKQFTYALFDERVPAAPPMPRAEALGKLVQLFFTGHGPGTAKDFTWWTSLTLADAKAGLELAAPHLEQFELDGQTFWQAKDAPTGPQPEDAYLVAAYDEYLLPFKNRGTLLDGVPSAGQGRLELYAGQTVVADGQVFGVWKRVPKKDGLILQLSFFRPPSPTQQAAIAKAIKRYQIFAGVPVQVQIA
jgi:hypothetical protein